MDFLSDMMLATAAIGAAVFCLILSRRLRALSTLDSGMGSAIAILSSQVDELSRTLKIAQETARKSAEKLEAQTRRAEGACRQIELLMASLHDLPSESAHREAAPAARVEPQAPAAPAFARPLSSWTPAAARRPPEITPTSRPRILRRRSTPGDT